MSDHHILTQLERATFEREFWQAIVSYFWGDAPRVDIGEA